MKNGLFFISMSLGMMLFITGCQDKTNHQEAQEQKNVLTDDESETVGEESKQYSGWTDYDLDTSVVLGEYNEIQIKSDAVSLLSDDDISAYVNHVLEEYPQYSENKKKVAEKGDCIEISLTGHFLNDTELKFDEKSIYTVVGEEGMFVGEIGNTFEGHMVGDTYECDYTYPDDYTPEECAGQTMMFTITINGIYDKWYYTIDTVTEKFVQNEMDCYCIDDFICQIKNEMYTVLSSYEASIIDEQLQNELLRNCTVKLPAGLLEEKQDQVIQQFIRIYCNGNEDAYAETIENYSGMTVDEYEKSLHESMEDTVKFELLSRKIAEREGISADDEGFTDYVSTQMNMNSISDKSELYELYETSYESGEDYLKTQYLITSVKEMLADNVVLEKTGEITVTDIVCREQSGN